LIDRSDSVDIDPGLRDAVVAFLRDWLPPEARRKYRELILANPDEWTEDPHFAQGIIPEHALRGNGIDEKVLGVSNLDAIWPDLLKRAVEEV
jgi:hypothetical protein